MALRADGVYWLPRCYAASAISQKRIEQFMYINGISKEPGIGHFLGNENIIKTFDSP